MRIFWFKWTLISEQLRHGNVKYISNKEATKKHNMVKHLVDDVQVCAIDGFRKLCFFGKAIRANLVSFLATHVALVANSMIEKQTRVKATVADHCLL